MKSHVAFVMSRWFRPWPLECATRIFSILERVSARKVQMCLLVMVLTIGVRLALLHRMPIPQPFVTDEFSHLLGAETFASGRLTNAPHVMWEHFETFHELMRPTYMTMYPPGQALVLAVGWRLFGYPWFGVLIGFGVFGASLCWMLQQWMPPAYALLGTAVMLARVSILSYWMNSYWGGAVAAAGGCLLLGSLPHLAGNKLRRMHVVFAALGMVTLANTRPFEGLVMTLAALIVVALWRKRLQRGFRDLWSLRYMLPFLAICSAGMLLDCYYNYRVTGHAFVMPYAVYFQQYRSAPPLIVLPERANPPIYLHSNLKDSWTADLEHFRKIRSNPLVSLREMYSVFTFYCSPLWLFAVALGIMLSGSYKLWSAVFMCACVCLALFIEYFKFPHYVAGAIGLLALLATYGLRVLGIVSNKYGPVLVLSLAALMCMQGIGGRAPEHGTTWETRSPGAMSSRMIASREVLKQGDRHLILVRYSGTDHIYKSDECIYNGADIDAAQIVWAHDMGEPKNRELINYYGGRRKVWLFEPDANPQRLAPYELDTN